VKRSERAGKRRKLSFFVKDNELNVNVQILAHAGQRRPLPVAEHVSVLRGSIFDANYCGWDQDSVQINSLG
jgi:hypothetical protein